MIKICNSNSATVVSLCILLLTATAVLNQERIYAETDLVITGIVYEEEPMAIVNGRLVREGDEVDGALVKRIGKDSVAFSRDGQITIKRLAGRQSSADLEKERMLAADTKETGGQAYIAKRNEMIAGGVIMIIISLLIFASRKSPKITVGNFEVQPEVQLQGIDTGWCVDYRKLSYRRKFIRTLWVIGILMAPLLIPGIAKNAEAEYIVVILLTGGIQGIYTFIRWRKELRSLLPKA